MDGRVSGSGLLPRSFLTACPPVLQLRCDAVFLSDLHLGSRQCEADGLLRFLACIRPHSLVLVGDVLDVQALRHHAGSEAAEVEHALVCSLIDSDGRNLFDRLQKGLSPWLPDRHRRVIARLARLIDVGVEIVLIPGNHDALLRAFCPRSGHGWRLCREYEHRTPIGERILAVHGDEEDALVHFHDGLAQALLASQETYSAFASGLRRLLLSVAAGVESGHRFALPADGHDVLGEAIGLLHRHWPTTDRAACLDRHGLSPAFTVERLMKRSFGHDRQFKRQLLTRLRACDDGADPPQALVCGHTHIPEATLFALPKAMPSTAPNRRQRASGCACHVTFINDGSWARAESRLGRTALVVADDGGIGMVQLQRGGLVVAYQPPRFAFNTYPMRPCPGCGVLAAVP
jgi:UDP-2,3-diacylglucosamine pyrophosphatase LpxH